MRLYEKLPAARDRKFYDMVPYRGAEQEVGALLYGLVRILKPQVCVETGTYVADSTEWIAKALHDNHSGHLTTCDVNEQFVGPARSRLAGFPVTVHHAKGIDVLSGFEQMDFVFIDSGNGAERLAELMSLNEKNISPGGLVCWHDAIDGNGVPEDCQKLYEQFSEARAWPHLVLPSPVGLAIFHRPE